MYVVTQKPSIGGAAGIDTLTKGRVRVRVRLGTGVGVVKRPKLMGLRYLIAELMRFRPPMLRVSQQWY